MFGTVEVRKSEVLLNLCHWDDKEKDGLLTLEEADERNLTREDYKYWSILEEVSWR